MIHKLNQSGCTAFLKVKAKTGEDCIVLIPNKEIIKISVIGAISKLEATNYIHDDVENNAAVWQEVGAEDINPAMTALRIEAVDGTEIMVNARIQD